MMMTLFEALRGGLDAKAGRTLTGGTLSAMIDAALVENVAREAGKSYLRRRSKSIPNRVRMRHLPAAEADDPRYHEMRAAGWSPAVGPVRV